MLTYGRTLRSLWSDSRVGAFVSKSSGSGFASFKRAVGGGGNKVNDEKSSGKYF